MKQSTEPRALGSHERLARKGWILWGVTWAVVFSLTAAVTLLYVPLIRGEGDSPDWFRDAYHALVGLGGLVVVFVLFSALRHRELEMLRRELNREELETEDARTRLSELSALFQLSTTLNMHLSLDMVLEIIARRTVSTLRAQQASIMIYNPESGLLETRATYGLESEFARNAKKKLGEGIAGWVAQRGESVLLNPKSGGELGQHFKNDRNITSALSMPLRVGERCVGVLNVNRINHTEAFQERHRDMLGLFAEHVGAVVERAEAMERLGTRSRELEQVNRQLAETNRLKDLFLSTASHELKTPLTSVIAYAELLDENSGSLSGEQRGEFLRRLRGEAERLLGLIDDILDLGRIESGKLTLKRGMLDVNEVAKGAIETSRTLARKHGVGLRDDFDKTLPKLNVDEVKLRQAVVNLLVNAIKFSPEGGEVVVRTDREPRYVRIVVSDHGPGIRPDEATHIFELFGQGVEGEHMESERPKDVGLGIGLHLVKRICELHGGHVGVNSTEGQGSHFWIRLPVTLAEEVAEPATAAAAVAAASNGAAPAAAEPAVSRAA